MICTTHCSQIAKVNIVQLINEWLNNLDENGGSNFRFQEMSAWQLSLSYAHFGGNIKDWGRPNAQNDFKSNVFFLMKNGRKWFN